MNAIEYGLDKTMCRFWAHFALDKATNGQTYIKHVNTYLNVTFEDRPNAPTFAKIEFGKFAEMCTLFCLVHIKYSSPL